MTRVSEAVVSHVPERARYELRLGDELVGLAAYTRRGDRISFTHTEVDPERRGHGLASLLVGTALEDARRDGLTVFPLCPFVAHYIAEHREYANLVPSNYQEA